MYDNHDCLIFFIIIIIGISTTHENTELKKKENGKEKSNLTAIVRSIIRNNTHRYVYHRPGSNSSRWKYSRGLSGDGCPLGLSHLFHNVFTSISPYLSSTNRRTSVDPANGKNIERSSHLTLCCS